MEKNSQKIGQIRSAALESLNAFTVEIESSLTKGLPAFNIVGMTDESIKESKERIKSALLLNDFSFPPLRITISLAPSDRSKKGSHFDLPMALLIALEGEKVLLEDFYCFGELGLDGKVKATDSIFAIVLSLATENRELKVIVPNSIAKEISMIFGVEVYGVESLMECVGFFKGEIKKEPIKGEELGFKSLLLDKNYYFVESFPLDFEDVRGQSQGVRAALIAAAGFHNLLLTGSPGSGKSMISKRISYILPPMSLEDILFCSKVESLTQERFSLKPLRPCRSPHHSSTKTSIFGGGTKGAKIGEIALASRGVLFFDELPHFSKSTLEALREPMEDREMLISRVNSKVNYETDFLFIGAMNPCPCGNLLSKAKECRCNDLEISRYKNRLSDPFLDRIDLFVEVVEADLKQKSVSTSKEMQNAVLKAFTMQKRRKQNTFNSRISDRDLEKFCPLDEICREILEKAIKNYGLSLRSVGKIKRVARTIADLDSSKNIEKKHLLEALSFRNR